MFNFVFDHEKLGRPYPNLAPPMDASGGYHNMGNTHPWITPPRVWYFCQDHNYPYTVNYLNQPIPNNALYPVGLGWFDFSIDYFALMSQQVLDLLKNQRMRVLFWYHEGDNPVHQKTRLDSLVTEHQLPKDCYIFVSGNTVAKRLENFVYFPDHELFYWRNGVVWNQQPQAGAQAHTNTRSREFTMLSRTHKWPRATIMGYLHKEHLLDNSYWSYNVLDIDDRFEDNPIKIHDFPQLEEYVHKFLAGAPYTCDTLTADEHNSHWITDLKLFEDSYCQLVLETFFDADGSDGAFISEKTFKSIRHAQPFVIFGCTNTLTTLRELGYKTYDAYIDNAYDKEVDNTERFVRLISTVNKLKRLDLHDWYLSMLDDIKHNQELFCSSQAKYARLDQLATDLNTI